MSEVRIFEFERYIAVPHLCLIHNQNTKLGRSVISLPESPASGSQIYTGDSQGLRLLLTTSGLHLANDKMYDYPPPPLPSIRRRVEQHCPGADYWHCRSPRLGMQKEADPPDSSAKNKKKWGGGIDSASAPAASTVKISSGWWKVRGHLKHFATSARDTLSSAEFWSRWTRPTRISRRLYTRPGGEQRVLS